MSTIKLKSEFLSVAAAVHGAIDYAELERFDLHPDEVIDFSVNSNPYGPPPGVRDALAGVPLDRYPDRECLALRRLLSSQLEVSIDNIVVGNGSAELLSLIAQAFLEPGDLVTIPELTFSEYDRVASLAGADKRLLPCLSPDQPVNEAWMASQAKVFKNSRVVFLCNPNNPSGQNIPVDWIMDHWVRANPRSLFVIDEAYANFLPDPDTAIKRPVSNMIVLRSMTKDFALAGLRLGYLVGEGEPLQAVRNLRNAWNVNAFAQAAGVASLSQQTWLRDCVDRLHRDKDLLIENLRLCGLDPLPSAVHYFLVRVGNARKFRQDLLSDGIMVRDATSFDLPEHIRIATRKPEENERLCQAIDAISR